jgi:hypothetical protein
LRKTITAVQAGAVKKGLTAAELGRRLADES